MQEYGPHTSYKFDPAFPEDLPKPMTIKRLRAIKREISRHLRKERNKLKNLAKLQSQISAMRSELTDAQREFGRAAVEARKGY